MSETQSAISFKVPADLRQKIAEITRTHDTTLTALVLDYFRRRVQAEEEAEGRGRPAGQKYTEVSLLLEDGIYAGLQQEASRQGVSPAEYIRRLCEADLQHQRGQAGAPGRVTAEDYPDFPKLVECVRRAYMEDRSPIDALLGLYPTLSPSSIPMDALFTAAVAAVPVGQVISERVELGLRLWREQNRGGRRTDQAGSHRKQADA